jgi:hypothetical protein
MPNTFTRTVSGLLNFRRFIKSSYVIFCEGGSRNIPVIDALTGDANLAAEDRTFWEALFRAIGFQDIHLKPLGSARHVLDVADFIIANDIPGNLAVLDRDFPGKKRLILDHRVLYSYGYSWENDAVTSGTVSTSIVGTLHLGEGQAQHLNQEFVLLTQRLYRLLKRPIMLQLSTTNPDCDFVPTDANIGGCISEGHFRVELSAYPLYERIQRNKARFVKSSETIDLSDVKRHVPGHGLMGLAYAFISIKSRVRPVFKPSRSAFTAVILQTFTTNLVAYLDRDAYRYYQTWAGGVK